MEALDKGVDIVKCSQSNLQHCKAASAILSRDLAVEQTDISLIQEPWIYRGHVKGIDRKLGSLIYDPVEPGPRACVFIHRRHSALKLSRFCSRDLAVASVRLRLGGALTDLIVCSAYLPYDSEDPPPTRELRVLADHCRREGLDLVVGCDANSHHVIWGSSNTNERGSALLQYLSTTNLEILNKGSKPTFVTARRQQVIDLTLGTPRVASWMEGWRVGDVDTLSDHRRILFNIKGGEAQNCTSAYRNPRTTDWNSYREALVGRLGGTGGWMKTERRIEEGVNTLTSAIIQSYEAACPVRERKSVKKVAWWSGELSKLRSDSRRMLNRAMKTMAEPDWAIYRATQRTYKRLVKSSKRKAWEKFCGEMEALPIVARLRRVFTTGPQIKLGGLTLPNGGIVEKHEDILAHLMEVHFPGSTLIERDLTQEVREPTTRPGEWATAAKVVTPDRIRWALDSFDGYKSPGADGIFPALLQQGGEDLVRHLNYTFRSCMALRYVPMAWREVIIVFIPKPGKASYDQAKAFRPISLTSFLLKTMERLVDRYIRDGALALTPVHHSQHAYQAGKSVETALHNLVHEIEQTLNKKEATLCVFLDVEGAFDNTSFDAICEAAREFRVDGTIIDWMHFMLRTRTITASLSGTAVRARVGRGCPQGGVTSPLMWLLVVDGLLRRLEGLRVKVVGFADDVCIAVSGNHPAAMAGKMQRALDLVGEWCTSKSLRVNPNKTEMVLFTRKRRFIIKRPSIYGAELSFSSEVRYLGVTLDSKLSWKSHITKQARKATVTFWACRRMFGQTWGLKPRMVRWIYTAILVPQLIYASLVWWPALRRAGIRKTLGRVYRLAGLGITGALGTTPTLALGALLDILPPHIAAEAGARNAAIRLLFSGRWTRAAYGHTSVLRRAGDLEEIIRLGGDWCPQEHHFHHNYQVLFPDRQSWIEERVRLLSPGGPVWYTDGAKSETGTGAGVWSEGPRTELSVTLGHTVSVLQAELFAIRACARSILRKGYSGKHLYICSDSRAALGQLLNVVVKSELARDCINLLTQLSRVNRVKLLWVPGHSGIQGNEKAHELARLGAIRPDMADLGDHPGVAMGLVKQITERWAANQFADLWSQDPGMRHTKELFSGPAARLGTVLADLDRTQLRVVVGLVTGHWHTNKHLVRLGLAEEPICQRCKDEEETPLHLITRCRELAGVRNDTLGAPVIFEFSLKDTGASRLLRFAREAGLPMGSTGS